MRTRTSLVFAALAAALSPSMLGCSSNCLGCNDAGTSDTNRGDVAADAASDVSDVHDAVAQDTTSADSPSNDVAMNDVATNDATVTDAADAPVVDVPSDQSAVDVPTSDGSCQNCIDQSLSWGNAGGFIAFQDTSHLDVCATFTADRTYSGGSMSPLSCMNGVPECGGNGSIIDMPQVLAALMNPDVVAAFDMAPVMYGRFIPDVGSFQITYGGRTISIAGDCAGATGCTNPPPGVAALRTLLQNLTMQQVAQPPCATTFPSGF